MNKRLLQVRGAANVAVFLDGYIRGDRRPVFASLSDVRFVASSSGSIGNVSVSV